MTDWLRLIDTSCIELLSWQVMSGNNNCNVIRTWLISLQCSFLWASVSCWCYWCVRMDDNLCLIDNDINCSVSSDVDLNPYCVKVYMLLTLYLYMHIVTSLLCLLLLLDLTTVSLFLFSQLRPLRINGHIIFLHIWWEMLKDIRLASSFQWHQKGKPLDFNEAGEASAVPHVDHLHLAPDR